MRCHKRACIAASAIVLFTIVFLRWWKGNSAALQQHEASMLEIKRLQKVMDVEDKVDAAGTHSSRGSHIEDLLKALDNVDRVEPALAKAPNKSARPDSVVSVQQNQHQHQHQQGCTIPHPAPDLDWENGKTDDSAYDPGTVLKGALSHGEANDGADFNFSNAESAACAVPLFSKLVSLHKGGLGLRVDCSQLDHGHSPAMFVGAGDLPIESDDLESLTIMEMESGSGNTATFVIPPDTPMVSALCSSSNEKYGQFQGAKWNLRNPWPTLQASDTIAARAAEKRDAAKESQPMGALGGMNVVVAFFDAVARTQWERAMKRTNDLLGRWAKDNKALVFDFEKFHGEHA